MECIFGIVVMGAAVVGFVTWAIARAGSAIDDAFGEDDA